MLGPMDFEPIAGAPVRLPPPGRVKVKLTSDHWRLYRRLYNRYGTVTDGLPVLRERDFDGRAVTIAARELEALNRAFADEADSERNEGERPASVFESQADERSRLFKRLQFLS
jgi:hypothetical protein